jgi:hypothetical protein
LRDPHRTARRVKSRSPASTTRFSRANAGTSGVH